MFPVIELYEQFGYKKEQRYTDIGEDRLSLLQTKSSYSIFFNRNKKEERCLQVDCIDNKAEFQTSYFVGIDWLIQNELAVYVQPKLNKDEAEINYMKMLLEAINEPENVNYLDELITIDFNKPTIKISQSQDILSPFLIAQYLQLLQHIVRKGLKKSYYPITENLNGKVKGKILVGTNIKQNTVISRNTHTVCQYQEFGVNCEENKILKKAYLFSSKLLQSYQGSFETQTLDRIISYIHPAFAQVTDDIDINRVKQFKINPLYKEYEKAIKFAILILKRFSFNITKTNAKEISTPPYWIDMSKLFELYTFSKLRKIFPKHGEIRYQIGVVQNQKLDFLIKSADSTFRYVVDTKYKPHYENHMIQVADIRQLSGYARVKSVYKALGYSDYNQLLKCLVIYSHQGCDEYINMEEIKEEDGYVEFYKLGVRLPEIGV